MIKSVLITNRERCVVCHHTELKVVLFGKKSMKNILLFNLFIRDR